MYYEPDRNDDGVKIALLIMVLVCLVGVVYGSCFSSPTPVVKSGITIAIPDTMEHFNAMVDPTHPVIHSGALSVVVVKITDPGSEGLRSAVVANVDAAPSTEVRCAPYSIPSVFSNRIILQVPQAFVICQAK